MNTQKPLHERRLLVVLGDQLNADSVLFEGMDPAQDTVWMAEVAGESLSPLSSQMRTAVFLSAMRHFADDLRLRGLTVHYTPLGIEPDLATALKAAIQRLKPDSVSVVEPGDYRLQRQLVEAVGEAGLALEILPDTHFLCSTEQFRRHAKGRKSLRMEYFYREMRKQYRILLEADGSPTGGEWNYDTENRVSFGKEGPGLLPVPLGFKADAITCEVISSIRKHLPNLPGRLEEADFRWAVTRREALLALDDFIENRLPNFGAYQDALWTQEPFLYHSLLSSSLNLKLLKPLEVIAKAEAAFRAGKVSLAAAEGFIRQILGWREYVRGVYQLHMPGYLEGNALEAREPLPDFYWTSDTEYRCLQETLSQTLRYGYAHHIQRLMVTGLFALLLGVEPKDVHAWYLAVYVDAVEWVEVPNTLGMSQYADGGLMASKPYAASGKYIDRMSNYCAHCRYDPEQAYGERACPFTTLYWDFLSRNRETLSRNARMGLQVKNLERKTAQELERIAHQALKLRETVRITAWKNSERTQSVGK